MEEYKKILVPIDGSELSKKALLKAISIAQSFGSEITILHVEEPPKGYVNISDSQNVRTSEIEYLMNMEKVTEKILNEGKAIAEEKGMEIETISLRGHISNEIIEASRMYDIIVMGTHGRSGLKHLFIGSVAEKVARHACCPVLLIREKYIHCN